ncbi:MAG: hypothetical protein V3S46_02570 [Nitrospinota bacterium]
MDYNLPRQQRPESASSADIVGWLAEAWKLFKKNAPAYVISALLFIAVMLLSQFIPYVGGILVTGPIMVGLYLVIGDQLEGRDFDAARIFAGFSYFVPAFMANLIITIFSTVGFFLLIVPGIIIGSWYLFTFLFIIDRDMDFWAAMEASRQVAFNDIIGFAFFYATLIGLNAIGFLLFAVGLFITIPVSAIAVFVAYNRLVGSQKLTLA